MILGFNKYLTQFRVRSLWGVPSDNHGSCQKALEDNSPVEKPLCSLPGLLGDPPKVAFFLVASI